MWKSTWARTRYVLGMCVISRKKSCIYLAGRLFTPDATDRQDSILISPVFLKKSISKWFTTDYCECGKFIPVERADLSFTDPSLNIIATVFSKTCLYPVRLNMYGRKKNERVLNVNISQHLFCSLKQRSEHFFSF